MASGKQRSNKAKRDGLRTWLRANPGVQVALIGLAGTLITAIATVVAALVHR